MKIYTKTGDAGQTSLYGGKRVPKDSIIIETIGDVDELNSHLGLCSSYILEADLQSSIKRVQGELFTIGAELATPAEKNAILKVSKITEKETWLMEQEIDLWESSLLPLTNFILPGGNTQAAELFVARSVCRRAERNLVSAMTEVQVNPEIQKYLNRLSDWLFVLARTVNMRSGVTETKWNA